MVHALELPLRTILWQHLCIKVIPRRGNRCPHDTENMWKLCQSMYKKAEFFLGLYYVMGLSSPYIFTCTIFTSCFLLLPTQFLVLTEQPNVDLILLIILFIITSGKHTAVLSPWTHSVFLNILITDMLCCTFRSVKLFRRVCSSTMIHPIPKCLFCCTQLYFKSLVHWAGAPFIFNISFNFFVKEALTI